MGNAVTVVEDPETGVTTHEVVQVVPVELTRELAAALDKLPGRPAGFDFRRWMRAWLADAGAEDVAAGRPDSAVGYAMAGDVVCYVAKIYQRAPIRPEARVDREPNPKKELARIPYGREYLAEHAEPGYVAAECNEHLAFEEAALCYLVAARVLSADTDQLKVEIADCLPPPGGRPKIHGPVTVGLENVVFAGYC